MKTFLLFFIWFWGGSTWGVAQSSYVRKSIEKKYEGDRQKGVNAVDERLEKWEEVDKEKRAQIKPFATMSYDMELSYPDKPQNNMTIQYYFKNYDCVVVYKTENQNTGVDRTLLNFKEGKSTTLMTDKKGKKTGVVTELKSFDWLAKSAAEKNNKALKDGDVTLKATDEYKTIEGYKCRKYIYEDMNHRMDMWMANNVGIETVQLNQAMYSSAIYSSAKNVSNYAYQKASANGVAIQTHIYPKSPRQEESVMTIKNIKNGSVSDAMFSTEGYEIAKMPSLRDIWKTANEKED